MLHTQTADSEYQVIRNGRKTSNLAPEAHDIFQTKATNSISRRKDTNERKKVKTKGVRVIGNRSES
jgi:hypothetical protein